MDDQKFEEFCTDLLNLHPEIDCLRHGSATTRRIVKADRLLSGTDQRGPDNVSLQVIISGVIWPIAQPGPA
jgi:hypothetical protein